MNRFLIIQTAFLGDVILMTPLLSELKRIYPEAKIDVLIRKGNESLLANNPAIHQLFIWNKKDGKYKSMRKTIKEIRKNKYDEVITLQRYASASIFTFFAKAKSKIGFDTAQLGFVFTKKIPHNIGNGEHEVKRNLKTIAHHGATGLKRPELFPSDADFGKVSLYKSVGNYVCFAPASVWFTKQLPEAKWIELLTRLAEKNQTIYLLGAPEDKPLCERIAKNSDRAIVLAGELSLMESAALMKDASMNYVNDSGPLHIASAMNAPVTAFFCSTTPHFGFGPLSDNRVIVESTEKPECKPCGLHGYKTCPKGHFACGNGIDLLGL
jgi:lipopolysaccharide heptosyltransferase II